MKRLSDERDRTLFRAAMAVILALAAFGLLAGMARASGDSDSDPTGACCFEKPRPDGTFIDECSNDRTEAWCEDRQNPNWSEGLDCDEVSCPPIELGSCCIDCLPESGDSDLCEDEATEAYCDESGGSWLLDTPCSQRDDCGDECPVPRVEGAICEPELAIDPGDGEGLLKPCEDQITLEECKQFFSNCEADWVEGETCETIVCKITQVPTMPRAAYALLALVLVGAALLPANRFAAR